ncbi:MAG: T9SS type A sorting domain-containing protein [Bacteroidetes bacterium]|nr:T9SS type A sorting domain-containing protein [Bacteroidota bacterium]
MRIGRILFPCIIASLMSLSWAATPVVAQLSINPSALDFSIVRVGSDRCLPLTLRNNGDTPLILVDVINPVEPFQTVFPQTIDVGAEAVVELCFLASHLGPQSAVAMVVFENGRRDTLRVPLNAVGYDSITVGITSDLRGRPGSVVRIPIAMFAHVPASYQVHGLALTLGYNATMLYPLSSEIVSAGTRCADMQVGTPLLERSFVGHHASVTYRIDGMTALSGDPGDILLAPPFLVLHGDATETPVRISHMRFDGNQPAAGVAVNGLFHADSLSFQDKRLLNTSERRAVSIVGSFPNPFITTTTIAYAVLREATHVRLTIYDAVGRRLRVIQNGLRDSGVHHALFDARGLPPGMYFYRLESGTAAYMGSIFRMK